MGMDEVKKLIKAYEDYIWLNTKELEDVVPIAYYHGWRSKRFERGKELREKIRKLKDDVLRVIEAK